jgi:hypothetical protein
MFVNKGLAITLYSRYNEYSRYILIRRAPYAKESCTQEVEAGNGRGRFPGRCEPLTGGGKMGNQCEEGLDGRCRDEDGSIRRKRGDTLVGTLRGEYGPDFAEEVRRDMRLDTLLEQADASSLNEYLRPQK